MSKSSESALLVQKSIQTETQAQEVHVHSFSEEDTINVSETLDENIKSIFEH